MPMKTLRIERGRGFTLIELIIGMVVGVAVFVAIFYLFNFASKQIGVYVERYHMYSQLGHALDHLRAHLVHAVQIDAQSQLLSETDELDFAEGRSLRFEAERSIYAITPNDRADNADYEYRLRGDDLVFLKDGAQEEILVDGRFKPNLRIRLSEDDPEPHFLEVIITANSTKQRLAGVSRTIVKVEGIKLWFIDAVR